MITSVLNWQYLIGEKLPPSILIQMRMPSTSSGCVTAECDRGGKPREIHFSSQLTLHARQMLLHPSEGSGRRDYTLAEFDSSVLAGTP